MKEREAVFKTTERQTLRGGGMGVDGVKGAAVHQKVQQNWSPELTSAAAPQGAPRVSSVRPELETSYAASRQATGQNYGVLDVNRINQSKTTEW